MSTAKEHQRLHKQVAEERELRIQAEQERDRLQAEQERDRLQEERDRYRELLQIAARFVEQNPEAEGQNEVENRRWLLTRIQGVLEDKE